jgi:predicted nucleic acid-binding protein
MGSNQLVADACATLNLLATGRAAEILQGNECRMLEPSHVCGQIQYLWTMPDENGERSKEPISTEELRALGLLTTVELTADAERSALIEAAGHIHDCDAACIALAGMQGLPLLTDDGKERRLARMLFPSIELVGTLELIRSAGKTLNWTLDDYRRVAMMVRWRANFLPPRDAPEAGWYAGLLE